MPDSEDDPAVDRYAIGGQLPCEVELIRGWLRSTAASMTDELSEWSEEERAQMRPGCRVMLEVIDGEMSDAVDLLKFTQEDVRADPATMLERSPTRYRTRAQAEDDLQRWWAQIRATVRGFLRDTVDVARSLGVDDSELAALLDDVTGPHDSSPIADVIPIAALRASRPPRTSPQA